MNKILTISAIALIAVVMVVGSVSPALADKGGNPNGGNSEENRNNCGEDHDNRSDKSKGKNCEAPKVTPEEDPRH